MPQVISASRRTDIPAFYSEWFLNRLSAGSVFVRNPYSGRFSRVSLLPEDLHSIFFCSKNYAPLLPKLELVEQATPNLYFHFTITGNREVELHVPDYRDAVRDYLFLTRRYSQDQVVWRYDPVCITDKLSFEIHEERFLRLAEMLKGHARRCFISFVHPYKKAVINMKKYAEQTFAALTDQQKRDYAERLASRAEQFGIRVFSCCGDYLISDRIKKGRCVEGELLSRIFNRSLDMKAGATRKECGCSRSADIGAYDTCPHGCAYCYATTDKKKAADLLLRHDPSWNSLGRDVREEDRAGEDKKQFALFEGCPIG